MLPLRWLIIDEISIVGLELLAQLEHKLRSLVRQGSPFKRCDGGVRPFGGLNVLVIGDLWQVPHPTVLAVSRAWNWSCNADEQAAEAFQS